MSENSASIKKLVSIHDLIVSEDSTSAMCLPFKVYETASGEQTFDPSKGKEAFLESVNHPGIAPFRTKVNIKSIDEQIANQKGLEYVNPYTASDEEMELAISEGFDMPVWFAVKSGDVNRMGLGPAVYKNNLQMINQFLGCNMNCTACYVDDKYKDVLWFEDMLVDVTSINKDEWNNRENRNAIPFVRLTPKDFFDSYKVHNTSGAINGLRISGGETTIPLEVVTNILKYFEDKKEPVLAELDTNASTIPYINYMIDNCREGWSDDMFGTLSKYLMVLFSFKGTDDKRIEKSTGLKLKVEEQMDAFQFYLDKNITVFPFLYDANPETLNEFLDDFTERFGVNSLERIIHYPYSTYSPTKTRLTVEAKINGLNCEDHIKRTREVWNREYKECGKILEDYFRSEDLKYPNVLRARIPQTLSKLL